MRIFRMHLVKDLFTKDHTNLYNGVYNTMVFIMSWMVFIIQLIYLSLIANKLILFQWNIVWFSLLTGWPQRLDYLWILWIFAWNSLPFGVWHEKDKRWVSALLVGSGARRGNRRDHVRTPQVNRYLKYFIVKLLRNKVKHLAVIRQAVETGDASCLEDAKVIGEKQVTQTTRTSITTENSCLKGRMHSKSSSTHRDINRLE